jgi:hypothetical protein
VASRKLEMKMTRVAGVQIKQGFDSAMNARIALLATYPSSVSAHGFDIN